MASIRISELRPAGSELFSESESFMDSMEDVSERDLKATRGGGGTFKFKGTGFFPFFGGGFGGGFGGFPGGFGGGFPVSPPASPPVGVPSFPGSSSSSSSSSTSAVNFNLIKFW